MRPTAGLASAAVTLARLERSQWWPVSRLRRLQRRRLEETLHAASRFAFYRELWGSDRSRPLEQLPVLERQDVPRLAMEAERNGGRNVLRDRSSGSTGMPAEFLFDRRHQRGRFAARARYLFAHRWSPMRRNLWIIYLPEGTPDGALVRSRALLRTRFLSIFAPLDEQVRTLRELDPHMLYTMPSNLEGLLERLEREEPPPSLRHLLTGGEVVDHGLRERARSVLGLEIADNYGSTEAFIAWQCAEGGYHVNAEHVAVEVVDDAARPVGPGEMGRVLVTTLENRLMPLVRYEIGDWAIASDARRCPCGRGLPLLGRPIGRSVNMFRTAAGELVNPWALVVRVKHEPGLRQLQIVQESLGRSILRYVGDAPLTETLRNTITDRFREVLGEAVEVGFERVDAVPRSPTGKYMTAVSRVGTDADRGENG